jgi:hypothetical protein
MLYFQQYFKNAGCHLAWLGVRMTRMSRLSKSDEMDGIRLPSQWSYVFQVIWSWLDLVVADSESTPTRNVRPRCFVRSNRDRRNSESETDTSVSKSPRPGGRGRAAAGIRLRRRRSRRGTGASTVPSSSTVTPRWRSRATGSRLVELQATVRKPPGPAAPVTISSFSSYSKVLSDTGKSQRWPHLEGWVMSYNTPPCYITGCYVAFLLYNTFFMLYNTPGGVI